MRRDLESRKMKPSKSKVKVRFEGQEHMFLVGKTTDFSTLQVNSMGHLVAPKKAVFFHMIKRASKFQRMWGFIRVEYDFINFIAIGREVVKVNQKSKKLYQEYELMLKLANEVTPADLEQNLITEKLKILK